MKCFWGKWFRNIAAALIAVLLTACLAGCSSDEPEKEKTTPTPTPTVVVNVATATPTPTEAPTPTPDDKVHLTMWCDLERNDVYYEPFMEAIEELQGKYPNTDLEIEFFDVSEYWSKVVNANDDNTLPDIIYVRSGYYIESGVESGMLYSLDDAYAPYRDALQEKMFTALTYGGRKYAIPFNLSGGMFLYANMDILESVGFEEVPQTIDDLYDCCDKLLAKGIVPFRAVADDGWQLTFFMESLLLKTCGAEELMNIYTGKTSWDNPKVAEAIGILQEMVDKGYLVLGGKDEEGNEVDWNFVQNEFVQCNNAFRLTYGAAACEYGNFMDARVEVAEFPVVDASEGRHGQIIGAPTDAIAVCNKDGDLAYTAEYAFELAKRVSRYAYQQQVMPPVWTVDYDDSDVNAGTRAVAELLQSADVLIPDASFVMESWKYGPYYSLLPQVASGTIDAAEFVGAIETGE